MSIFIDLTKPNPKTKRSWTEQRYLIINGFRVEIRWVNKQRDEGFEKPERTCLHWSAGNYSTIYDGYHYNIVWDSAKNEAYVIRTLDWNDKSSHLWKRNTSAVGIVLCCMADGAKPKAKAILTAGILNSEVCAWKNINPRSRVSLPEMRANSNATQLTPTGRQVNLPACWDHAGYAQADNYGPWRWDCRLKLDFLEQDEREEVLKFLNVKSYDFKNKTVFDLYLDVTLKNYDDLKAGRARFIYEEIIK